MVKREYEVVFMKGTRMNVPIIMGLNALFLSLTGL
jgi:hypothetical protein